MRYPTTLIFSVPDNAIKLSSWTKIKIFEIFGSSAGRSYDVILSDESLRILLPLEVMDIPVPFSLIGEGPGTFVRQLAW